MQELLIIGVMILILFGAKKLPEMGRGLGHGIREFQRATTYVSERQEDK